MELILELDSFRVETRNEMNVFKGLAAIEQKCRLQNASKTQTNLL